MSEQDQQVTVRLLPDGDARPALLRNLAGSILRIDLLPLPSGTAMNRGDLVEITCPETLYLGEVRTLQGNTLTIGVEHALDRATLALIQQVWHGPGRTVGHSS